MLTQRKLRALYGLGPEITVFRLLQHFWELEDDSATRPILALLCATARDPLLRSLTPILTSTEIGEELDNKLLRSKLKAVAGDRLSESTLTMISGRVIGHGQGTWYQNTKSAENWYACARGTISPCLRN